MLNHEGLTLASLADRCAQESELFLRRKDHDPRFCYELFRRAILDHNREAWELLYAQYQRMVAGWVVRHPAFPVTGEETQYFVNRAFEKMWRAMTPDKFGRFPDLKPLLRYLQMCVHSVIVDYARLAEHKQAEAPLETLEAESAGQGSAVEAQALAAAEGRAFWQVLESRLQDDKERRVIYGSFVLDLKPRELQAAFHETFLDVEDVYRVKQNVLSRLRRDEEIRKLLFPDD